MSDDKSSLMEGESKKGRRCRVCLRENILTLVTIAGVVIGVVLGVILRNIKDDWTDREVSNFHIYRQIN